MGTLRRKALAMFMAVLLGMASFAVLAEEPLESENKEVVDTVESVSNGDSVIYDKTSEKPDDVENEDTVDEVASIDMIDTDDVIDTINAVNIDADNMADAEEELKELAEDQGIVYAVDDIASGVDGDITWVIDASGKLTVNGAGDFSGEHASDNFAWKPYSSQIISAEINVNGMTDASYLFYGCSNMVSVNLENFDTSNVTDMHRMFSGCSGLTSLDVSGFNTSNVTDMWGMFSGCSGLTSLDIDGFDTSNVTYMLSMFDGCSGLTRLDVSGFNTSNVTNMWDMFSGCSGLTSLDVGGIDTSNVMYMGFMFSDCSGLTSLDVSGFDTSNVTDMRSMFSGCNGLTGLDVSGFNTSNVTNMGDMFRDCSGLTSLEVDGFDTSNVTDMICMFRGCSGLTRLDVSSFNTSNVTDLDQMFYCCSGLTRLDVSGFNTSNVTSMWGMFWDCSGLTSLDVSGFNTSNVMYMDRMFSGCSGLTSLDVSGFNTSNVTGMGHMFNGCSGLTSLDVSGFNTSNVTGMDNMFSGCSGLTSLDVDGFDTSNVMYMSFMFSGCSGLTRLDVSGFNTNNVTGMVHMFIDCSGLTSLDVSGFNTSNVTDMGDMFYGCSSLTTLHSPCNVNNSVSLPFVAGTIWHLADGTEVTELLQGLSYSVTLTRIDTTPQIITTTDDLNMDDVIRVKYVPYSYTVETDNTDEENTVTFSIAEGSLAEGLQMYPATGEIYGVPLETGEFKVTVMATYSNPEYPPSYAELTLIVLDNTDDNVDVATDPGYDITQPVVDFNIGAISGEGTQTLVSQGEYAQFQHIVYIDGRLLEEGEGKDYTSEAGSTRITILNQTLADGGEGTHTLGIEFRTEDGTLKRAAQNYTVSSSSEDNGEKDKPGDGGNGEQNPGNESGDDKPSAGNIPENSGNDSNIGKADSSNKDIGIDVIPVKNSLDEGAITTVEYTIVSGDTLWSIAERFYGNGCLWTKIYEDNAEIIRDANKIYVGQVITIYLTEEQTTSSSSAVDPEKSVTVDGEIYVVQSGDSLWKIAVKFYDNGHQWRKIYEANQEVLRAPSKIYAGQVLVIPDR
ncbi:MAG: BspA family leucine-rich repeat surface protein [Lachnospiraceae bacterium]|nr:BspA family leucine-rich repeat surface protein [Lachnospiraceae bacterium]